MFPQYTQQQHMQLASMHPAPFPFHSSSSSSLSPYSPVSLPLHRPMQAGSAGNANVSIPQSTGEDNVLPEEVCDPVEVGRVLADRYNQMRLDELTDLSPVPAPPITREFAHVAREWNTEHHAALIATVYSHGVRILAWPVKPPNKSPVIRVVVECGIGEGEQPKLLLAGFEGNGQIRQVLFYSHNDALYIFGVSGTQILCWNLLIDSSAAAVALNGNLVKKFAHRDIDQIKLHQQHLFILTQQAWQSHNVSAVLIDEFLNNSDPATLPLSHPPVLASDLAFTEGLFGSCIICCHTDAVQLTIYDRTQFLCSTADNPLVPLFDIPVSRISSVHIVAERRCPHNNQIVLLTVTAEHDRCELFCVEQHDNEWKCVPCSTLHFVHGDSARVQLNCAGLAQQFLVLCYNSVSDSTGLESDHGIVFVHIREGDSRFDYLSVLHQACPIVSFACGSAYTQAESNEIAEQEFDLYVLSTKPISRLRFSFPQVARIVADGELSSQESAMIDVQSSFASRCESVAAANESESDEHTHEQGDAVGDLLTIRRSSSYDHDMTRGQVDGSAEMNFAPAGSSAPEFDTPSLCAMESLTPGESPALTPLGLSPSSTPTTNRRSQLPTYSHIPSITPASTPASTPLYTSNNASMIKILQHRITQHSSSLGQQASSIGGSPINSPLFGSAPYSRSFSTASTDSHNSSGKGATPTESLSPRNQRTTASSPTSQQDTLDIVSTQNMAQQFARPSAPSTPYNSLAATPVPTPFTTPRTHTLPPNPPFPLHHRRQRSGSASGDVADEGEHKSLPDKKTAQESALVHKLEQLFAKHLKPLQEQSRVQQQLHHHISTLSLPTAQELASALTHQLGAAFKHQFSDTLLPTFERAVIAMMSQIKQSFAQSLEQQQQNITYMLQQMHKRDEEERKLRDAKEEARMRKKNEDDGKVSAALQQQLNSLQLQYASLHQQLTDSNASHTRLLNELLSRPAAQVQKAEEVGNEEDKHKIIAIICKGQIQDAFIFVLSLNNLSMVLWLCSLFDSRALFTQHQLSPAVLLSLIQHLSTGMAHNTRVKLRYLVEALLAYTDPRSAAQPVAKQIFAAATHQVEGLQILSNTQHELYGIVRMVSQLLTIKQQQ